MAAQGQGERSYPPWKLIELHGVSCGPMPSEYIEVDPNHLERDMIDVMEAQRREFPQDGGFCRLTSVTQPHGDATDFAALGRVRTRGRRRVDPIQPSVHRRSWQRPRHGLVGRSRG